MGHPSVCNVDYIDSGFCRAWNGLDSQVLLFSILNILKNIFDEFGAVFRLMERISIGNIIKYAMYLAGRSEDSLIFGLKINSARFLCGDLDAVDANRCLVECKSFGFRMCG